MRVFVFARSLKRSAFERWQNVAGSERDRQERLASCLRNLVGLAAGSTRDRLRVAFGRWHENSNSRGAAASEVRGGVTVTRMILKRWEAGKLARAFHHWRTEARSAHSDAAARTAGVAATRAILVRWERGVLARSWRTWTAFAAFETKALASVHAAMALTRGVVRRWESGVVGRAFHLWVRQTHKIRDAAHGAASGAGKLLGIVRRWQAGILAHAFHEWRAAAATEARRQDALDWKRGLVAMRLAEQLELNLRAAWVRWRTRTQLAAEAIRRQGAFAARRVLGRRQTMKKLLRVWQKHAQQRVRFKKLLRKWLVSRPLRRLFHHWRIIADRR